MPRKTLRTRFARLASPQQYVVFYDASCTICQRLRHWLEQRAADAPMRFIDINDRATRDRWLEITPTEARQQVVVIDPGGRLSAGYDAVVRLLEAVGTADGGWRNVLRSAPVSRMGGRAYDMVSQHRHRLSRWLFRQPTRAAAPDQRAASAAPFGALFAGDPPTGRPVSDRPSVTTPAPTRATPRAGRRRGERSVLKGAVAGAVGGLVASFVMERVQEAMSRRASAAQAHAPAGVRGDGREHEASEHADHPEHASAWGSSVEPATVQAAQAVSRITRDRELEEHQKPAAGEATHYAFGAGVGATYGVLAELVPATRKQHGLIYGLVVWIFADEIGVPLAGLGKPPHEHSLDAHGYALGSHLVYGFTLETTRRIVRAILR